MTSSPTVSSRKWTDSVTPENIGPDRHDERARLLNDAPRPPVGVRKAIAHRRLRIEAAAHRLDTFLPGVVVEHEIAQTRMALEAQAEQILRFAFVPVRRVNPLDDAREDASRRAAR